MKHKGMLDVMGQRQWEGRGGASGGGGSDGGRGKWGRGGLRSIAASLLVHVSATRQGEEEAGRVRK